MASLTATVVHARGRKTATTIGLVKLAGVLLARTTQPLAGKYTEAQLLARLKASRDGFTLTEVGQDALPALLGQR